MGVSGGADSVAMLYLLQELASEWNLELQVIHVNHQLRGKESGEDAVFVEELANRLNIPFSLRTVDIYEGLNKKKVSQEDAARRARYKCFIEAAEEAGADKIAVAHNYDDVAETFLMRLIRGSGLKGLSGIWPRRVIKSKVIIRPLIDCRRRDIRKYLKEKKIKFRRDSSNSDTRYLRNKVRLKLLPYLSKNYNPRIADIMVKEAGHIRQVYKYIRKEAQDILEDMSRKDKRGLHLSARELSALPAALRQEVIRQAVSRVKGNLRRITREHIENIETLLGDSSGSKKLNLPADMVVLREYDNLVFTRYSKNKTGKSSSEYKIKLPGITELPAVNLRLKTALISKDKKTPPRSESFSEYIDLGKIKGQLRLRTRREADKFKPLGMKKTKSLKDFFIDNKIPRQRRANVALVVDDEKIIWVVGYRISESVKLTSRTKNILKISAQST